MGWIPAAVKRRGSQIGAVFLTSLLWFFIIAPMWDHFEWNAKLAPWWVSLTLRTQLEFSVCFSLVTLVALAATFWKIKVGWQDISATFESR